MVCRGWTGISVKEEVITEHKFGELDVRMWTKEEINGAIDVGKLDQKDVNKAKNNCPVDIIFYWQFSGEDLPRGRAFIPEEGGIEEENGTG